MNRSERSPLLRDIFGLVVLSIAIFSHSKHRYAQVYPGNTDDFVLKLGSGTSLSVEELRTRENFNGVSDYQIGDSWGKMPVAESDLPSRSPAYIRAALATASFNSATAFYLGRFGQWHVMFPKEARIQNSSYLRLMQKEGSDEVWSLLTYAVPAAKISEKLTDELQSSRLTNENGKIVQLILDN